MPFDDDCDDDLFGDDFMDDDFDFDVTGDIDEEDDDFDDDDDFDFEGPAPLATMSCCGAPRPPSLGDDEPCPNCGAI